MFLSPSLSLSIASSRCQLFLYFRLTFWLLICTQLKFHSVIAARTSFNYIRSYWPQLFDIFFFFVVFGSVTCYSLTSQFDFLMNSPKTFLSNGLNCCFSCIYKYLVSWCFLLNLFDMAEWKFIEFFVLVGYIWKSAYIYFPYSRACWKIC